MDAGPSNLQPSAELSMVGDAVVDVGVSGGGAIGDDATDTAEEKRLKRMRRNRDSAALSRNRKKQYVESLEAQITSLQDTVKQLHGENYELRREHARITGQPEPPPPIFQQADEHATTDGLTVNVDPSSREATPAVAVAVIAPSPRASDALLGLELLSRSASHEGDSSDRGEAIGTRAADSSDSSRSCGGASDAGAGGASDSGHSSRSVSSDASAAATMQSAMRVRPPAVCGVQPAGA